MDQKNQHLTENVSKTSQYLGTAIVIGLALMAGVGTEINNIAAGVGAGLVLGIAIGSALFEWNKKNDGKE